MSSRAKYKFEDQAHFEQASRLAQACWNDNKEGRRPELCTLQISPDNQTLLVDGAEGESDRFARLMVERGITFTKVDLAES